MKKITASVLLLSAISTLIACSSTKMRDVWQADDFDGKDFTQVLVVAATDNVTSRLIFESEFSAQLKKQGIEAIESNKVMGNSKPNKEKVLEYLTQHKVKYVLAARLVNVELDQNYVQPTAVVYSTGGGYYPGVGYGAWGGWGGNSTLLTTEGYMDTNKTYILETMIFNSQTEALVWAGKSASFEATSVSYVADDLAKLTIKNIQSK